MPTCGFPKILGFCASALFLSSVLPSTAAAQGLLLLTPKVAAEPSPFVKASSPETPRSHKFWDRENRILFATSGALSVADFAVTRQNVQNGGREMNPVARVLGTSTPALALNFAGENAGMIGISYFFHKTGHHKLERITSMVNISASGFAVGYGLTHR